jgi:hypothetical protein
MKKIFECLFTDLRRRRRIIIHIIGILLSLFIYAENYLKNKKDEKLLKSIYFFKKI